MKTFNQPDLNAPRFRPKRYNILNNEFCKRFRDDNPKYNHLSNDQIKDIVKTGNGHIWRSTIDHRDGIEFPEQLGYLFIGTCPRKKTDNIDYVKSLEYGRKLQNQNWESDQYVAKIFYTNYETKYRFRFHELWGFQGVRDYKRTIAATYQQDWKKYIQVDNMQHISRLFRTLKNRETRKRETATSLETYDEFLLD
jgi:hypothetical protein